MSEIETEAKPASFRAVVIKTGVAIGLGAAVILLPTPEGLTPQGQRFLGVLLAAVVLWVSEALPIGVTALLAGAGLIFLKIRRRRRRGSPAVLSVLFTETTTRTCREVWIPRPLTRA